MILYAYFCQMLAYAFIIISTLFMSQGTGRTLLPTGKIVHGTHAYPGQYPYLVSIQYLSETPSKYIPFCGGAILDHKTILTAAHCFDHEPLQNYRIVAGEHDLYVDERREQVVEFSYYSSVVTHADYDGFHYDNDIALIKLHIPLTFNKFVNRISLVDPERPYRTTDAVIAGWGRNSSNSNQVDVLLRTEVDIYSDDECLAKWGDDFHPEDMICAGKSEPDSQFGLVADACQGDSGGPLVAADLKIESVKYLVGIISWGFECGYPEYPGLYTKIANYLRWIKDHGRKNRRMGG